MRKNEIEALVKLGIATKGTFDFWRLSGKQFAGCRASLMSILLERRITQTHAGVTAMREAFQSLGAQGGGCICEREQLFARWAKQQVARTEVAA